jgi:peptidoglycan hydrolase CwlO-like protein
MTKIQEITAKIKQVRAQARAEIASLTNDLNAARIEVKLAAEAKRKAKEKAKAQKLAKAAKAKMASLHPDHGGPGGEVFHAAHKAWKQAEARAGA